MITKNIILNIREDIVKMVKEDQELRRIDRLDNDLDKIHTEKLKKIISEYGWPKLSEFGIEVSEGAWLIVQHAVHDISFQKKVLDIIKKLSNEGEFNKQLIPLLEDRILVGEGKSQKYGTQFYRDETTGKLEPKPIEDIHNVNKRRFEFGLNSLEEYSEELNRNFNV